MDTITLKYAGNTKSYQILGSPRGLQRFDETRRFPPTQHELSDGSVRQRFSGSARIITLRLAVVKTKADRLWLHHWVMSNAMQIVYGGETINVVLDKWNTLESKRESDFVYSRSFVLVLHEKSINTSAPASWVALLPPVAPE